MNRGRVSKLVGVLAVAVVGLLSMGCGPSPAYEPDYPQGYVPPPPPLTADELAARQAQAQAQAAGTQEVAIGGDASADEYTDTDPSALTEFRPVLEGHGTWVEDPAYGTVWVPSPSEVGTDFQPYVTAGHWTYSDSTDWVWVSDYDWGWAPFHYGRWVYLPGHGWSWIPGRRYAGAWVVWRTGPAGYGYIGWAPAPPAWYWYRGVAFGWTFGFYDYHHHYVYCARDYMYDHHMHDHVARGPDARAHDGRTADYVPAQPGVGPGLGEGGGGGRVIATPNVGGPGRVAATPTVERRGPRPSEVGIKDQIIVPPPKGNAGLERAQAYATARSAVERGAAPPAQSRFASVVPSAMPRSSSSFAPTRPDAVTRSAPGAVSPLPPRQNVLPEYRSPSAYSSRFQPTPPAASRSPRVGVDPLPGFGPSSPGIATSPSVRSPSVSPPPSYRPSAPSYSSPPPSFRPSTPSFRPSSPSFRPSTPSFRPSSPSPSFRPSTPSFRPSAPSVRSSPSVSAPRSPAIGGVRGGVSSRRR
jgi:hypothetical protein